MEIALSLNSEQKKYLEEMDKYIKKLSDSPQAEEEALAALKRTGVITQKGNLKKKIVSWE